MPDGQASKATLRITGDEAAGVGFDALAPSRSSLPQLRTLRQPLDGQRTDAMRVELATELDAGGSTAQPNAA